VIPIGWIRRPWIRRAARGVALACATALLLGTQIGDAIGDQQPPAHP